MENFNLNQVSKSLMNHGFKPTRSFGNDIEATYLFEKSSSTEFGVECATVEEWVENGSCTIDGLHPKEWAKNNL